MKSVEQEYIKLFRDFYQQIWDSLISFESPQFYRYTVELSKEFRAICTKIGKDLRFQGMERYLDVVRNSDREAIEYAKKLKRRYENHPERAKAESPNPDKFTPMLNQFYFKVDQIHPPAPKTSELIPKSIRPALLQTQSTIRQLLGLEISKEDQLTVDHFRNSMTNHQKQMIRQPLNIKEEIKIFRIYAVDVQKIFNQYEQKGWFNSINNYAPVWLKYLEKIREKRQGIEYIEYDNLVKQTLLNFQEWVKRVKKKYEGRIDLALDGVDLINSDMKDKILSYKHIRRAYIRFEENKRILKYLRGK